MLINRVHIYIFGILKHQGLMPCTRYLGVKRLPAEKVLKHTVGSVNRDDGTIAAAAASAALVLLRGDRDRAVFVIAESAIFEAAAEEDLERGLYGGAADAAVRPEKAVFQPQVRNLAPLLHLCDQR